MPGAAERSHRPQGPAWVVDGGGVVLPPPPHPQGLEEGEEPGWGEGMLLVASVGFVGEGVQVGIQGLSPGEKERGAQQRGRC